MSVTLKGLFLNLWQHADIEIRFVRTCCGKSIKTGYIYIPRLVQSCWSCLRFSEQVYSVFQHLIVTTPLTPQIETRLLINLVSLLPVSSNQNLSITWGRLRENLVFSISLCMFQCKNSYKKTCRNEMFFYKIASTVYNYACSDWPILVFGSEYRNTDISRYSVFFKNNYCG